MTTLIVLSLIVVTGGAFASGVEAALFSCPIIKAREIAEKTGSRSAQLLLHIRQHMSRPISAVVILTNIFNIIGSLLVGAIASKHFDDLGLGLFSACFTFVIIIFAEIIPKNIGERYSLSTSLFAAYPVHVLTKLLSPFIWSIEKIVTPFRKRGADALTTESEIRLLVQLGYQEGIIEHDEAEMIHRIFRLNDISAKDIMTPRVSLTALEGQQTLDEAKEAVLNSQHSRIVVTGESIDEITGIALKDDLLRALIEGRGDENISALCRPARFVPTMVHADNLLRQFQENREHLLVVVDEFGGTAGVVTLEDVLEVLTGEIVDETDRVMDMQAAARQFRWRSLLLGRKKRK